VTRDVSAFLLVKNEGEWSIVAQAGGLERDTNRIPSDLLKADG
jgi:hypothetical protein